MKRLAPLLLLALAGCNIPVQQPVPVKVAGPFKGSVDEWLDKALDSVAAFGDGTEKETMVTAEQIRSELEKAKSVYPKGIPPASMRPADKLFRAGFDEIDEGARSLKVAEFVDPLGVLPDNTGNAQKHYDRGFDLIEKAVNTAADVVIEAPARQGAKGKISDPIFVFDEDEMEWMLAKEAATLDLSKAQRATGREVRGQQLAKGLKNYPKGPVPPKWKKLDTVLRQAFREMQLADSLFNQAATSTNPATSRSHTLQAQRHLKQSKRLTSQLESLELQAIEASSPSLGR